MKKSCVLFARYRNKKISTSDNGVKTVIFVCVENNIISKSLFVSVF